MAISDDIGDYRLSRHAAIRGVEMALDPQDIIDVILRPHCVTRSVKHPDKDLHLRGRLAAAIDPETKTVITILWNLRYIGHRWDRDDIDLCRDELDWTPPHA